MSRLIRQICSSTFYGTLSPRFIHQDGWYVSLWECGNDMEWQVPVKCSKSSSCINFMKCQTNCWRWDLAVQIGYSSVTVRNKHMFDMGFCTLRWTLPHFLWYKYLLGGAVHFGTDWQPKLQLGWIKFDAFCRGLLHPASSVHPSWLIRFYTHWLRKIRILTQDTFCFLGISTVFLSVSVMVL